MGRITRGLGQIQIVQAMAASLHSTTVQPLSRGAIWCKVIKLEDVVKKVIFYNDSQEFLLPVENGRPVGDCYGQVLAYTCVSVAGRHHHWLVIHVQSGGVVPATWYERWIFYLDVKCEEYEFKCNNHKCVHASTKCDGINDCGDNSDETNECLSKFS